MRWLAILALVGCRFGFDSDGAPDASDGRNDLPHIDATGWSVSVFADLSSTLTYVPVDFVDGTEMYDNMPIGLFVLRPPYQEVLGVIAGREVYEVGATTIVAHDFGNHAPDDPQLPDQIIDGLWSPRFAGGNPTVLLTSSSAGAGDGLFAISTQWISSRAATTNNTRAVTWDDSGAFDARGTPEAYLGANSGVFRNSDQVQVIGGDTVAVKAIGDQLLIVRRIAVDADERIILVSSMSAGMYPQVQLAQYAVARLGDGAPPAPAIAWAVADGNQLLAVNASGAPTVVASSSDPDFKWRDAATPPAGHALASHPNIVYVLETNRVLDIDRVLVFTSP
ncbi:MAG TPA: hypothetical protein VIV11_02630 [Kofleriaceae bacterium]